MSTPLVALCVGHSRLINGRTEGGAISVAGVSEHVYNSGLARMIQSQLATRGIPSLIVDRYEGNGYTAAQRWLAAHLKAKGATLAIELHWNASENDSATGHEWLFWQSSVKGKKLAGYLDFSHRESFPNLKARGLKPKGNGDRGAEFLKFTSCPAVIAEPFFGSNLNDWQHAEDHKEEIATAYAEGIRDYLNAP